LQIQDAHLAEPSERLLDDLGLRPNERVVEVGCGPGGLSQRILRRLGPGGVLVGVDSSASLLAQARHRLAGQGPACFETVEADIAALGPWLQGADVVVGRAVLHHVPMAEVMLGRLRTALRPGTRLGFLEPDFRSLLARLAHLEATGRPQLAPLRVWNMALVDLYQANRISPDIGATMARALECAGYRNVRAVWSECPPDELMIENMSLVYDEIRERLAALGILTAAETEEQKQLLRALKVGELPAVWATSRVTCASS
jgi:ubiquinone/menaquinone biosynthesis C-methylase UbiE